MNINPYNINCYLDCRGIALTKVPDEIGVSASAVIFDRFGYVLLQKRSDIGWWGLPGGKLEIGENFQNCIVREVKEETNLLVNPKQLIKVYSDLSDYTAIEYPDGKLVQYITALFLCEKISGYLNLSNESTDIGYYDPDMFPDKTLFSAKLRVKDTQEFCKRNKGEFDVVKLEE